ncbi:MAG: hypothetical protein OHK0048_00490 [Rhodoferax sp.]
MGPLERMKFPRRLRLTSIKVRFGLLLIVSLVLSLLCYSIYVSGKLRSDLSEQIIAWHQGRADHLAQDLGLALASKTRELEALANKLVLVDNDPGTMRRLLENTHLRHDFFKAGVAIVRPGDGVWIDTEPAGNRFGDKALQVHQWTRLQQGKSVFGLSALPNTAVLAVPLALPKWGFHGLVGRVDLTDLSTVLTSFQATLGSADEVSILDVSSRRVLLSNNPARNATALPPPGSVPAMDAFFDGTPGTVEMTDDQGQVRVAAHAPIADTSLVVAWIAPVDAVYAPTKQIVRRLLIFGLLLTALMGLLAWWSMRRTLAPVVQTLAALSQVDVDSKTVVQVPVPAERLDELDALIDSFNRVLSRLHLAHMRDQLLFEQTPLAAIEWDAALRVRRWNRSAQTLFGYTAEEAMGQHADFVIPQDQRDRVQPILRRLLRGQGTVGENDNLCKDGRRIRCRWFNNALQGASGELLGFASFVQDLTEQRQAEQELRIAARVFDTHLGIAVLDAHRRVLRCNPALCTMLGYTQKELTGQRLDDEADPNRILRSIDWATVARADHWASRATETRADQTEFPVHISVTAVRDMDRRVAHHVCIVNDLSAHEQACARIEHLLRHDAMTDLPNRAGTYELINQALLAAHFAGQTTLFVLLDVDDFSAINESFGSETGDIVLHTVVERLKAAIPKTAALTRVGADVFGVCLRLNDADVRAPGVMAYADQMARRIHNRVVLPIVHPPHKLQITASLGMVLIDKETPASTQAAEVVEQAQLALRLAKSEGRNLQRWFEPSMQQRLQDRTNLIHELRSALAANEFKLYLQPQVNRAGTTVGAECLLRWLNPSRGLLGPGLFIPIAEETGDILALGAWVLDQACAILGDWASQPAYQHIHLSVNVSARQMHQADFVGDVEQCVRRHGAPPHRLTLELTESMLASNVEDVVRKMRALKALGVHLALDDFGTGYSSLNYLKRMPLDEVKIDQSFVRNLLDEPTDAAIAQVVLDLGKHLQLRVVAEGVETAAHRDRLAEMGCTLFQGYYFARPMPLDDFLYHLARSDTPPTG